MKTPCKILSCLILTAATLQASNLNDLGNEQETTAKTSTSQNFNSYTPTPEEIRKAKSAILNDPGSEYGPRTHAALGREPYASAARALEKDHEAEKRQEQSSLMGISGCYF